jgi:hypothetical protein
MPASLTMPLQTDRGPGRDRVKILLRVGRGG